MAIRNQVSIISICSGTCPLARGDMSGRRHAQRIHILEIAARVGFDHLHRLGIELRRANENAVFLVGAQVTDIGDVLHVEQVKAAITQVSSHHIKGYVGLGMTQMRMLVHRRTTDVHADAPFVERRECLLFASQHVEDPQCHRLVCLLLSASHLRRIVAERMPM